MVFWINLEKQEDVALAEAMRAFIHDINKRGELLPSPANNIYYQSSVEKYDVPLSRIISGVLLVPRMFGATIIVDMHEPKQHVNDERVNGLKGDIAVIRRHHHVDYVIAGADTYLDRINEVVNGVLDGFLTIPDGYKQDNVRHIKKSKFLEYRDD